MSGSDRLRHGHNRSKLAILAADLIEKFEKLLFFPCNVISRFTVRGDVCEGFEVPLNSVEENMDVDSAINGNIVEFCNELNGEVTNLHVREVACT